MRYGHPHWDRVVSEKANTLCSKIELTHWQFLLKIDLLFSKHLLITYILRFLLSFSHFVLF